MLLCLVSYYLFKVVKAKFNLNSKIGSISFQDNNYNIPNVEHSVIGDTEFVFIKLSFNCSEDLGEFKKGHYYYMLGFEPHSDLSEILSDTKIPIVKI